ncbi:RdgB/HAM1 family non-canonical purine NTP pyrophosphatase [Oceanicaulis sp. MMSF_3324]|uniref:RdgB/HAM1 family non-canonical purine NTP pyrophosphatase n=1 Tax=Oceanicaulis sp. MMSF_3324 TaxID=3046702 RepID=UPI00273DF056|nr:RdgB/HAM1 family non-canonical purine NTP pyrophosphatase [Oceanicaulis sp. MMSF_3324]
MTLFASAPKWAIASHNKGKIKEIAELIAPYGLAAEGAESLGLPEPEETEKTFTGNALLKARASAEACGLVSLADDSGLEVTALDGAPGIYSARWAGEPRDFYAAMDKVRTELEAKSATDYSARFVCALALAHPDGETRVYEGEVRGQLNFPPRGEKGFGYDPIFVPDGHTLTFAEMDPAIKHAMSHRAHAFKLLVEDIFGA